MTANTEPAILERIIEPADGNLRPALAHYLLSLDFKPQDHQRMDQLSSRAQAGSLAPDEEEELDSYISLGHLLALLQSKARASLKNGDSKP